MERILTAIYSSLSDAGLHVLRITSIQTLPRLEWPMVAIRVYESHRSSVAQDDLLGYHYSSGHTYGKELEVQAELMVYSPYRAGPQLCEDAISLTLSALDKGLSMANLSSMDSGPMAYDPDADCFCCRILATFTAWDIEFSALAAQEEGE